MAARRTLDWASWVSSAHQGDRTGECVQSDIPPVSYCIQRVQHVQSLHSFRLIHICVPSQL